MNILKISLLAIVTICVASAILWGAELPRTALHNDEGITRQGLTVIAVRCGFFAMALTGVLIWLHAPMPQTSARASD